MGSPHMWRESFKPLLNLGGFHKRLRALLCLALINSLYNLI